MKFGKFAKTFAPLAAVALATALAGCDGSHIRINNDDGKKLAELDLTGKAPTELVLAGPDEVRVTQGDKLAIRVEGDPEAAEHLRFTLDDETLGVMREGKWRSESGKVAVVQVTMPAIKELTLAGSGKITAAAMASDAQVTVAGSGLVETPAVSADKLNLTIAGSGTYRGAGTAKKLKLTVAGSGSADMGGVKVDSADITIAGSGNARLASDGEVSADIMGSGEVTVIGRAKCKVQSMGSGRLVCESGDAPAEAATSASPPAPEAPKAPEPPKAP